MRVLLEGYGAGLGAVQVYGDEGALYHLGRAWECGHSRLPPHRSLTELFLIISGLLSRLSSSCSTARIYEN